ncbi:MAG TPA: BatA domain-containing protein [Planctomycetaceae bacterium]|nr:BatA domain-containing protein [Planctomycetaceae bacterium]
MFSSLVNALSPFFLNPAIFIPGAALIAAPIIIHLLNRLRFKKVRFAAMEFLLQSQKRNKRRILFEQLLLLLLRIMAVLMIAALVARLIVNPNQLAILKGEKSHQLVLLDDSISMQDRWAETSAFEQGKKTIVEIVEQGSKRPGTQKLTVLLLSEPDVPFINGEEMNEQFLIKLIEDLGTLKCTSQSLELLAGLKSARDRLQDEQAISKTLHVISDFRAHEWEAQPALGETVKSFEEADIAVNLVKSVQKKNDNLALIGLEGELQSAAVNVPLRLTATVRNHSDKRVENVRISVIRDGNELPVPFSIDGIEAGKTATKPFEVVFRTPGRHKLKVSLDSDAIAEDNSRFLVLELLDTNPVLLIDGNPQAAEAKIIADALAADPSLTGISPLIQSPEFLRRNQLDRFRSIFLINLANLPADAVLPLKKYVEGGGGLVWFTGELTAPSFFNSTLYEENGTGIFPVRLGPTWNEIPRGDIANLGPMMNFVDHPMFQIFQGEENPFVAAVHIDKYFRLADDFPQRDEEREDQVRTLVTLSNGQPIAFEHKYGQGTIITWLTSAGSDWNDWAQNPSFVIFMLEMQKYIAKHFERETSREVGVPIEIAVSPSAFSEELEIVSPDEKISRIKMVPKTPDVEPEGSEAAANVLLSTDYRETGIPGVYRIVLFNNDQIPQERWVAFNPPGNEADLKLVTDDDLQSMAGSAAQIQTSDDLDWVHKSDPQQEVRTWLLVILFLILMGEQFMAYRLSFHSRTSGALA